MNDDTHTCFYRTPDGKKCAIGRHIPDDKYKASMEGCFDEDILKTLPEEIQELGRSFLRDVQILHDRFECLDENGLTDQGIQYVESIKKDHINKSEINS